MKINWRKALMAIAAAIVTAVLVFVLIRNEQHRGLILCENLSVEFTDGYNFVDAGDIKACLDEHYGSYIGQRIDSVRLAAIEKILDVQGAIQKSEAYTTDDGTLHIRISQRDPVVRFQTENGGFYIDERGFIFPLQENYTSIVPIVDGNIPVYYGDNYKGAARNDKDAAWMQDIIRLVKFLTADKTWYTNIVQISVDKNGDIILVPREGNEKFIFGGPQDIEEKFAKIDKYYQYIKPSKEENYYSTVNVKYKGQIICRTK